MKNFGGNVLFLDRSDMNTDEIIPARYLTEISKSALKPFLLEDLKLEGFDAQTDIPDKQVIVTRDNFGCGSSREHAAWALEVNGIHLVIATGFARIFRQNMFNCGMLAVELASDQTDEIFRIFTKLPTRLETDLENGLLRFLSDDTRLEIPFRISEFDYELVKAGGWVEFADLNY